MSHVRGPVEQVSFGGCPVTSVIPVATGSSGNISAYFDVLSYAGTLTITVIADPGNFACPGALTEGLRTELGLITCPSQASSPPG